MPFSEIARALGITRNEAITAYENAVAKIYKQSGKLREYRHGTKSNIAGDPDYLTFCDGLRDSGDDGL